MLKIVRFGVVVGSLFIFGTDTGDFETEFLVRFFLSSTEHRHHIIFEILHQILTLNKFKCQRQF